jgi:hypothetical protein
MTVAWVRTTSLEQLFRNLLVVMVAPSFESKDVVFAYASIGSYRSSIVLFFPRMPRPARAAGADDGSLSAPCAVVAPPSGPLAPV